LPGSGWTLGARLAAVEQELKNIRTQIADIKDPARTEPAAPPAGDDEPGAGFATGSFTRALTEAFG
jgi:hypothetical protein